MDVPCEQFSLDFNVMKYLFLTKTDMIIFLRHQTYVPDQLLFLHWFLFEVVVLLGQQLLLAQLVLMVQFF